MTARTADASRARCSGTTLPFALPIGLSAFLLFSVEPLDRPARPAGLRRHAGRLGDGPVLLPGRPAASATCTATCRSPGSAAGAAAPPRRWPGWRSSPWSSRPRASPTCAIDAIPRSSTSSGSSSSSIGLPALVLTTTTPLVSRLVRGGPDARRRRRPLLAVRAQQRRLAAGAARLPAAHRAAPRADGPARRLDGRLRASSSCCSPSRRRRALPALRAATARPVARRRVAAPPTSGDPTSPIDWPRRGSLAAPRRDPVRPAVRGHDVHRHRPRLGAAAVGRAAGDLSRLVHHRVLAARRPLGPAGRRRGPGDDHAAVGAVRLGRRLADPGGPRDGARRVRRSSRPPCTAGSPRTGPTRPT